MKSYFIIGTDTDCGKTHVTCELVRYLQSQNKKVLALKPVASGCIERAGTWVSGDAERLAAVQKNSFLLSDICPWSMQLPVSPHLAAKAENLKLSAQEIVKFCQAHLQQDHDYVLIEGAGGLMVPLNDEETWIDVLIQSQIEVILVVGMRLGCINHALLTIEALNKYQITCCGWIANCLDPQMMMLPENMQTLMEKITQPCLGIVNFRSTFQPDPRAQVTFDN